MLRDGLPRVRRAPFAALDGATVYGILRLRAEAFVVEQRCAFLDPDGRDTEVATLHVWIERNGEVVGALRMLEEAAGAVRVGRVVVAPAARGAGLANALMRAALEDCRGRVVVLDAQRQLVPWYERLDFEITGPDYLEDGILHTPMRRPATEFPG